MTTAVLVTRADWPRFSSPELGTQCDDTPHTLTNLIQCLLYHQRSGCCPWPTSTASCGSVPTCCLLSWLILAYTCPLPLQELLRWLPCYPPCLPASSILATDRLKYNTQSSQPLDTPKGPGLDSGSGFAGGSTTLTLTPSGTGTGPLSCTHAPR